MPDQQVPDLDGYAQAPAELPEVRILRLEPGDVLLLTSPLQVDDRMFDEISERMKAVFPGHKMVLLDGGLTLDILRKGGDSCQGS